jgi:uncharacterized membrane protein YadS
LLAWPATRQPAEGERPARYPHRTVTASGFLLELAVVLLGGQLSLPQVIRVGLGSLPVMLGTFVICLTLAALLGRWLRINRTVTTLIGVGTGICGASAIAAITPLIAADSLAVAYAISTIFLFNIAAVLTFPALGHLVGMSQQAFGLFADTAVNDTSSVVAAATSYGTGATQHAIDPAALRRTGPRPLLLGALLWIAVTSTSLILQAITPRPLARITPTSSDQGAVALWPGSPGAFIARTRSRRARATRERMVPIGHPHTSAAAA